MCGIVGTYGFSPALEVFDAARDRLAHRGPDGYGTYADANGPGGVMLGHRRLAIIDVSPAADQPLVKDGLAIVFNGEIYNFREIRSELRARGAEFRTNSDTEVLLEGWRAWKHRLFARLRGMFALAVYEQRERRLVLARDPFGIKPLFVHQPAPGQLSFSSELKSLSRLHGSFPVDRTAMAAVLLFDWIPEEMCIYSHVQKLPPGTWAEITPGAPLEVHSYWIAADLQRDEGRVSSRDLSVVLEDSVQAHMVADVEVGAFLSGGLDSSLIAAMAARHKPDLRCFTAAFKERDHRAEAMTDDLFYARKVANHLNLKLETITVDPNQLLDLPRLVDALDEPIGDSAALIVYAICTAAREQGIKVMLSGMGADELFGGYRRHQACLLASRYRHVPSLLRQSARSLVDRLPVSFNGRGLKATRWAQRFVRIADLDEEAAYRRSYTYYEPEDLVRLLGGSHAAGVGELCSLHESVYWRAGRAEGLSAQLDRMLLTDLHFFLPALNLAYTDRASMAASVEVRVPFVDLKVLSVARQLTREDRIAYGHQKRLLKEAAEDWLPSDVVYRPKASFGLPLRSWTLGPLRAQLREVLLHGTLVTTGHVDPSVLRELIDDNESGRRDLAQALWQLLVLEHWVSAQQAK